MKKAAQAMKSTAVLMPQFGRDHVSTMLYLETRIADYGGKPDPKHMRCNPARHPLFLNAIGAALGWDEKHGTRLADGTQLSHHDDWDCVDDMIAAGLLEWHGTGTNPVFRLTDAGWTWAHQLRRKRAEKAFAKSAGTESP